MGSASAWETRAIYVRQHGVRMIDGERRRRVEASSFGGVAEKNGGSVLHDRWRRPPEDGIKTGMIIICL